MVDGRVSVENVGVHVEVVARVAGSPVSRRMAGPEVSPTVADSADSQVVVAGQVMDARLVKTVLQWSDNSPGVVLGIRLTDSSGEQALDLLRSVANA